MRVVSIERVLYIYIGTERYIVDVVVVVLVVLCGHCLLTVIN